MSKLNIAVFGASNYGKAVLNDIGAYVNTVIDNDPAKHHTDFQGRPVIPADEIASYDFDGIVIASQYEPEIKAQLVEMGYQALLTKYNMAATTAFRPELKDPTFIINGKSHKTELRTMHIILTSACNIQCRICKDENTVFKAGYLSKEALEGIVEDAFDEITHLRVDSSGELTLYPHLQYVLDEATKRNISIFVSTNGTRINEKYAEMLVGSSMESMQVSLDSSDKATNEWLRKGAKHEDVLRGARLLVEAKKKLGKTLPEIHFHAAIFQQNAHQIKDLVQLADDMGINGVTLAYGFTLPFMDPNWSIFFYRELCNAKIDEAREYAEKLGLFFNSPFPFLHDNKIPQSEQHCQYLDSWTVVSQEGKVYPCCISSAGPTSLGSIHEEKLSDIWKGKRYEDLRKSYNTDKPTLEKCANCYLVTGWDRDDYKIHFAPNHWPEVEARLAKKDNPDLICVSS
jgi:radical SAM protein with 4Fe4S-binding SPASM domain